ncbi:Spc98 family-domain-containing protein [Scheffersomyces xylosifermentans]|uniref:Spc98 family-domain-containing protein n=1 Tax=Scheffersomyces xylosifermentans TaxID=1304137 RepID=UPI00315CA01B
MASYISLNSQPDLDPEKIRLSETASLVQSCVNAPLRRPTRIRPYHLSEINDLKIQSGLVIKDLLFALLGYEGCYIRYSEKYDVNDTDLRLAGPDFKIAKHLDISLKSIAKKLVKYGKYYSGLTGFYETYNQPKYGKVLQRLCLLVEELLDQHQKVIVEIESEFKYNANFNLNILESIINQEISNKMTHLYEITVRIHAVTKERAKTTAETTDLRFQDILSNVKSSINQAGIIDSLANNGKFDVCKGGLVLRIVQDRINLFKGDSISSTFLTQLFDIVSEDYIEMLNKWLINGEIDDPYDEFLIREKPVPGSLIEIFNARSEHYWNELFIVKSDGLIDQFSNLDVQTKILNTGKFLNVFKLCTGLHNFKNLHELIEPIDRIYTHDLELKIDAFYNRANKLLMKLLFEGLHFKSLIKEFQSIFLFENSFNIDNFLESSFTDLKRNRYAISVSRLQKNYFENFERVEESTTGTAPVNLTTSISEVLRNNQKFSITTSNFYEVAKEIMEVQTFDTDLKDEANLKAFLNRTLKRNIQSSEDDKQNTGYDQNHSDEYAITSIDLSISLPFPLNLILNRELSYHYELMFKILIIIKFITKFNDITWKEINRSDVWKYKSFEPRIRKWVLRCRVLHGRIRDFTNELQNYLNYDVVQSNFETFQESILKTEEVLKERVLGSDVNHNHEPQITNPKIKSFNNYNNNNSIFDDKISNSKLNKARITANRNQATDYANVENLVTNLSEFLNTLINDSLITKPDLLLSLKNMFDIIISFNHYLSRLKKVLILCDQPLFEMYLTNYPDKFSDKSMDGLSIQNRYVNLDNSLQDHFEKFRDALTEFIVTLRGFGESENKQILVLSERLEKCFPEN